MIKANNKKICIVVSSLGKGGAERSSALLSKMLYQAGFNVHIVSVLDQIDFSYEGTLLNLGLLKKKNDTALGRIQRLIVFKKYINKEDFDFIIDNRTRVGFFKEFIISRLIYGSKKAIYNIHSYKTDRYIHPNPFLAKIIYGSAYKMVTVSNAIANRIKEKYNFRNVSVIFNAVNTELNNKQTIAISPVDDYILFFGRLDDDLASCIRQNGDDRIITVHVRSRAKRSTTSNSSSMPKWFIVIGKRQDVNPKTLRLLWKIYLKGPVNHPGFWI